MSQSEAPQAFHIMAKPRGSACNLHCDYCFFLKKEKLYPGSSFRMSDEVHEAYIRQLLEAHQVPQVTVAWQGGESTLMGRRTRSWLSWQERKRILRQNWQSQGEMIPARAAAEKNSRNVTENKSDEDRVPSEK